MDLYRLFDNNNRLLYIGISYSAIVRQAGHKQTQPWWDEVSKIERQSLGDVTRVEAEAIEKSAIKREKPKYNITHNNKSRKEKERRQRIEDEQLDPTDLRIKRGKRNRALCAKIRDNYIIEWTELVRSTRNSCAGFHGKLKYHYPDLEFRFNQIDSKTCILEARCKHAEGLS